MNSSKVVIVFNSVLGKILRFIGYLLLLLMFFAVLGLAGEPSAIDGGTVVVIIIVVAVGVLLILKGFKIKNSIKRFKGYVSLISSEHITSLENIAASTSQSVDFVRNDIQNMINKKFFTNAYIDKTANEVVINHVNNNVLQPQAQAAAENIIMETAICSGCGAKNSKPKGQSAICEYCGSRLN